MNCALCGTAAVHDDQRFCARCGGELGTPPPPPADVTMPGSMPVPMPVTPPPPAAPIPPPPAYFPPPRVNGPLFADAEVTVRPTPPPAPLPVVVPPVPRQPKRRMPVLVLVVAALLAAAVGAGGVVLVLSGQDDDRSTAATDSPTRDQRTTSAPTSDAAPTSDVGQTKSATPKPRDFRCWDGGKRVAALAACGLPTGQDGLTWVFPSAAASGCYGNTGVQRDAEIECSPSGVRFHYSEWRSRGALETYYGGNGPVSIDPPSGRADLRAFQVESRDPDVGYKVAVYFADPSALWSVTIYAADRDQYLAIIRELDVRPFRDLRGKRA
ncbi:hypothetical protein F0U44_04450 [Nocardioides humilatus]|uniref:Uncharacterized protein n=1 Tax=Nocardioides humilatus TaxID=2607660 RepID=A0A5B1LLF3_9ACTN|nr:hypothetical protein [Nocardioides humilatus]KAA1421542.1 hypothetical protein F0U44_04450 [Nocardioides humilatus]